MKLTLTISWVLVCEGNACSSLLVRLGYFRGNAYHLLSLSAVLAWGELLDGGVVLGGCLELGPAAGLRGANMSN